MRDSLLRAKAIIGFLPAVELKSRLKLALARCSFIAGNLAQAVTHTSIAIVISFYLMRTRLCIYMAVVKPSDSRGYIRLRDSL